MAATKTKSTVSDAAARGQEFTEQWVDASKKAATQYLDLAEQATKSVVSFHKQVAAQTDVEWVSAVVNAQAELADQVGRALVAGGRDLVK
jgi:hypothetical protein